MIDIIIKVSQLLLSLSILVVLHELGHFIPAKLFKTKVEKFYLFFDWPFSLFKKKVGDTEYGIGAKIKESNIKKKKKDLLYLTIKDL